ncbi:hypothetical protein CYMTET_23001 [Cymbomonas tetramitiformis]|uniref:Uncharacterized protein n=1 Tax=Cymbomonas tetramitiformis TaxID=36881 RepID=A0AAE0FZ61_9CHLO|nr:hypothetical protein CYMTET_23001 [Cymbomonas tetramitiformis]
MKQFTVKEYKHRHCAHFVKASSRPAVTNVMLGWKPAKREKEMRLPMLEDTVRLTQLVANVVEQDMLRWEKIPDIHEDEWCLKCLKIRGTVARLPEEEWRMPIA